MPLETLTLSCDTYIPGGGVNWQLIDGLVEALNQGGLTVNRDISEKNIEYTLGGMLKKTVLPLDTPAIKSERVVGYVLVGSNFKLTLGNHNEQNPRGLITMIHGKVEINFSREMRHHPYLPDLKVVDEVISVLRGYYKAER